MKFNTDSHFVIGHAHIHQNKPCQDHAMHKICGRSIASIVVSDGCSSGNHTDIGARIITCSTIKAINGSPWNHLHDDAPGSITKHILRYATISKSSLGVDDDDMLATCSYAIINEEGGFIHLMGDGTVIIRLVGGILKIISLNWQNNLPYYLSYDISGELPNFKSEHSKINNGEIALCISESGTLHDNLYGKTTHIPIEEAVKGYTIKIDKSFLSVIESITIFSDGVQDFHKNPNTSDRERIEMDQIVIEMTNFKGYKGEFVKRRMNAALKKLAKEDIYPNDDFSMAVIYVDHEKEEGI